MGGLCRVLVCGYCFGVLSSFAIILLRKRGFIALQPRNYQLSKSIAHEIKFGDKAVMLI